MIIEEIRKKLLSTNHFKKASGVEELQRQLSNAKTRKLFIIETISADIAVVLTSILALRNDNLQRSILTCWEILSEDEYFYKNNVATTVIMKILETGTLIAVNQTKEQPILLTMAHTLALLFRRFINEDERVLDEQLNSDSDDSSTSDFNKRLEISKKIFNLSCEKMLEIVIPNFKEWMLKSTSVDSDKFLPDALTHLIEILLKVGIEKCYMCHPALVVTVLKNPIFPREIRHQVVKLWLKTDGDVYTLVDADHRDVVVDSLIHALKTGCRNVVRRASKDLIEIAKDTNPMNFDFMPNIWEQIFDSLITYKDENEHNFEGFLKLAEKLMTNDLSIIFAMRSVVKFTTFFSCNNKVNSNIKILLINLTNKMFSILANADESIVISSTIFEKNILNEIRDQAFKSANNDLAAACLKCLANIIIILIPVSKKLSQPLIITSSELIDTLSKDLKVSMKVLGLLNNLCFNYENYSDCVIIGFGENNVKSDIYEIYDLLIEIHNKVMSIEWKTTFDCLTNFLIFVKKNYPVAIRDCCENISIHLTIIKTIDSRYVGTEFIKFVNLWLEQGIKFHCSFIDGTFELNRMKIISQDNFCFESTFEKALKHLKIYIKNLDASHSISTALLENLNLKLNIL
ncbi:hypothetical protein KQX54_002585 [Cotesia glomerata]|uniref:Uncharacterized protein n=1 Tax=Cotesia glomerata TaxID=32391 RepID=A0AAV7IU49_COTGL|nr:hypothetical protein KQX54_002585 [Cotesia glomerata]